MPLYTNVLTQEYEGVKIDASGDAVEISGWGRSRLSDGTGDGGRMLSASYLTLPLSIGMSETPIEARRDWHQSHFRVTDNFFFLSCNAYKTSGSSTKTTAGRCIFGDSGFCIARFTGFLFAYSGHNTQAIEKSLIILQLPNFCKGCKRHRKRFLKL